MAYGGAKGYRVIPLLLFGAEPSALELGFGGEPVAVKVSLKPGSVEQALPELLAALGLALADDPNLDYDDAAELHLLLDRLGAAP